MPAIPAPSVQTNPLPFPPSNAAAIPIPPTGSASATDTLLVRSQRFVEEHKLLVLGAAVLAAGSAGYYIYSSSSANSSSSGGRGGASGLKKQARKGERRAKDQDASVSSSESGEENDASAAGGPGSIGTAPGSTSTKSKKKKRKSKTAGTSASNPLLSERTPEEVDALLAKRRGVPTSDSGIGGVSLSPDESARVNKLTEENEAAIEDRHKAEPGALEGGGEGTLGASARKEKKASGPAYLEGIPGTEELATLSSSDRKTFATTLKNRGNKLYSGKKYEEAIACYTKALEVAEKPEAVFYSNRAACYQNMPNPNYDNVIADCDAALKLDTGYVKALNRRATALETVGRDEEALRDFTATTIMERFQNDAAAQSVERVLRKISSKKAEEILRTREAKLPSSTFISSYLGAFRPRAKPESPANLDDSTFTGHNTLSLAFDAEAASDYAHAFTYVSEAIEQGISPEWKDGQAQAFNMRGTYRFLVGDVAGAKADFEKSLDLKPDYIQTLVKIASVHMELGDAAAAFGDFEAALRHDPNDADIYYHRGQLYFVTNEFEKAAADYEKSTSLDEGFVFSHVQFAVAQYKLGQTRESMASFRKIMKRFPDRSEPLNYYGEIMLDTQRFEDAIEKFEQATVFEKQKKPSNVLPLVNKALALFQWKQDMAGAEALCKEALEIDPECDVAVATLAQLSLQQGKLPEAISWFEKSAKLARTEIELTTAITYEYASKSQLQFLQTYPQLAERLGQLAQQV